MNTKSCIFCGSDLAGKRSIEHVFPQWLQMQYGLSNIDLLQTHFSMHGEVLSTRYIPDLDSHVCGRVCVVCNNGWMSNLETDAKPIVTQLAESALPLFRLSSQQCLILARWACKTAYVLHSASNYRSIVPADHSLQTRSEPTSLSPGVYVLARQHSSTEPFVWWQSTDWTIEAEEEFLSREMEQSIKNQAYNEAYKICFSVKDLILIVLYNPFPDMQLVLWKGNHYPVFPERGPVYWYERDGFPDENTQSASVALMKSIFLRQKKNDQTNTSIGLCQWGKTNDI